MNNNFSKLPDYLKYEIISFLDLKCFDCQKKMSILQKYISINGYYFCSKECRYLFFLYSS